jgi:hypothetical protein
MKIPHRTFVKLTLSLSIVLCSLNDVSSQFVKSPDSCVEGKFVPLLIVVHTAPSNVVRRNVLRQTWTKNDPDFKTVFVIGHSQNASLNDQVISELNEHNDILVTTEFRFLFDSGAQEGEVHLQSDNDSVNTYFSVQNKI